jgi:hypothetical protein
MKMLLSERIPVAYFLGNKRSELIISEKISVKHMSMAEIKAATARQFSSSPMIPGLRQRLSWIKNRKKVPYTVSILHHFND